VQQRHRLNRTADRLQFGRQALVAPFAKSRQPRLGDGLAGVPLDQRGLVLDRFADEQAHALRRRQRPAAFGQHVAQHTVGDGFAVDEHTVAVEQDRVKSCTHIAIVYIATNGHWTWA
jgi:hypothetical protein